jgi:AhpC/TSA family
MLEAGQAAPDFTLPDQDGKELTLSDLRGEAVVLYFYPRADTVSCGGRDHCRPLVEDRTRVDQPDLEDRGRDHRGARRVDGGAG